MHLIPDIETVATVTVENTGISSVSQLVYFLIYCFLLLSDHIPEDLQDPFYTDQYDQEHIKPPVIRLLLSCELYCRVCALILKGDQVASLQSHQSVIQALSRKGIYVMEGDDTPVTDSDLNCQPIKMVRCIMSFCIFGCAWNIVLLIQFLQYVEYITCVYVV